MPSGIPGSSPTKVCERCNTQFKYKPSVLKHGGARFCSRLCQNRWLGEKHKGLKRKLPQSWHESMRRYNNSRKGKPSPKKGKSYPHLRGENHWAWKGGTDNFRKQAKGQAEYKAWRTAVFARDNYTCQICEQHGGTLHADHIKRWADSVELRYAVDNGRTLCVPCHYYITFKRKMKPGTTWCNFTARKAG